MSVLIPHVKRCPETRAHYAHEWYTPLRTYCPGGPDEGDTAARIAQAKAEAWDETHETLCSAGQFCSAHRNPYRADRLAAPTPDGGADQ